MTQQKTLIAAIVACLGVVLASAVPVASQQETPSAEGQILHVFVGKSVVMNMPVRVARILSSNPAAIEAVAVSPTQVVVEGKAAGSSSLILWDEAGHSQLLDVVVDIDLSGLRASIEHAYPGQEIEVQSDAGRIILSGNIADPRIIDGLMKMAGLYSNQIVNSLNIVETHERQVLLEVRFAEVDRTKIDQFGINFLSAGAGKTPGVISTQQFGPPTLGGGSGGGAGGAIGGTGPNTTTLSVPDLLNIFVFRPDINLALTIKDLESKAVLQILAEPNLLALNGQKASFLAGGEFPFPVVQGGQNIGVVTIQFRPFGVRLDFTGTIDKDGVIRLHVAPEVSTLDFSNALTISGFVVPAISTRRAETEIELKDGQSFGIAGLLDRRAQAQLNKIPGIGDIPVLGLLFRSKSINRSNTELLVMVTPHVVDPIHASTAAAETPKAPMQFLNTPKFDAKLPLRNTDTIPLSPSPKQKP